MAPTGALEAEPRSVEDIAGPAISRVVMDRQGITLNVNIQLTVPDTKDDTLYDRFFESLKKHLLSG